MGDKQHPTDWKDIPPDWRKHPDLLSHQARLASCREKLPELAQALAHAEHTYHVADEALDQAEMLALAGQASPKGAPSVDALRATRDEAKRAYAVARVEHARCADEHAMLEQTALDVEIAAKVETARQHFETFNALLDTFRDALAAATAANEALRAYYRQAVEPQFPDTWYSERTRSTFPSGLGMASIAESFPELAEFSVVRGAGITTRYSNWLQEYAAYKAQGEAGITPPLG